MYKKNLLCIFIAFTVFLFDCRYQRSLLLVDVSYEFYTVAEILYFLSFQFSNTARHQLREQPGGVNNVSNKRNKTKFVYTVKQLHHDHLLVHVHN